MTQTQLLYALIAASAGIAVPVLASINAAYGQAIGNVHYASLTLVFVSTLTVLAVILVSGTPMPSA
ncbi:MAG: DMT family transporter, partial [Pseudomonadota bacterium]